MSPKAFDPFTYYSLYSIQQDAYLAQLPHERYDQNAPYFFSAPYVFAPQVHPYEFFDRAPWYVQGCCYSSKRHGFLVHTPAYWTLSTIFLYLLEIASDRARLPKQIHSVGPLPQSYALEELHADTYEEMQFLLERALLDIPVPETWGAAVQLPLAEERISYYFDYQKDFDKIPVTVHTVVRYDELSKRVCQLIAFVPQDDVVLVRNLCWLDTGRSVKHVFVASDLDNTTHDLEVTVPVYVTMAQNVLMHARRTCRRGCAFNRHNFRLTCARLLNVVASESPTFTGPISLSYYADALGDSEAALMDYFNVVSLTRSVTAFDIDVPLPKFPVSYPDSSSGPFR